MKTATPPAPAPAHTTAPAPRRTFSPKEYARLVEKKKRLCDQTPLGEFFVSPITGLTQLKTLPFTEDDVYTSY
jgi:hypothetical protein